jgi:hypothetical protein
VGERGSTMNLTEDSVEHRQIKFRILDYIYDLVGSHEILDSNGEKLRAKILNRLPHKVPSYLFDEIEVVAGEVEGKIFAALLFVMGIFRESGNVMEHESFVYLKNKAELQGSGRTLFN